MNLPKHDDDQLLVDGLKEDLEFLKGKIEEKQRELDFLQDRASNIFLAIQSLEKR
jgi:hypothetical protein